MSTGKEVSKRGLSRFSNVCCMSGFVGACVRACVRACVMSEELMHERVRA